MVRSPRLVSVSVRVTKLWQLVAVLRECDGQPAREVSIAEEQIAEGVTALLTGIPGHHDGVGQLAHLAHIDGAVSATIMMVERMALFISCC